jgi:hypothetical protein
MAIHENSFCLGPNHISIFEVQILGKIHQLTKKTTEILLFGCLVFSTLVTGKESNISSSFSDTTEISLSLSAHDVFSN